MAQGCGPHTAGATGRGRPGAKAGKLLVIVTLSSSLLGSPAIAASQAAEERSGSHGSAEIRFSGGTVRPLEGVEPSPPGWYRRDSEERSANGRRYLVALTRSSLGAVERGQLEDAGARIVGYYPVNAYRVRVDPEYEDAVRSRPFVLWLGETPHHLKIDPELSSKAAGSPPPAIKVRVVLEAGEPPDRALKALAGSRPEAAPSGAVGAWRVEAEIPGSRLSRTLSRLAGLPEVEGVEIARPIRPMNQDAVWVHQSFVGPSPQQTPIFNRGIFGCGQTLATADTGQDYGACYFRDPNLGAPPFYSCLSAPCPVGTPATNRRKDIIYYNWSGTPTGDDDTCPATIGGSGHGTHTSASMAGDANSYADCLSFTSPNRTAGDGQAPGAKLVVEEMGDGLEYLNNNGGTIWNLTDVAYRTGARIQSFSWGGACHDIFGFCIDGCTIPYDSFARDADLAMWTYPDFLLVVSAGNAGGGICPPPVSVNTPGNAKSPLTVGSVGHGTTATIPSSFSSPGPVFDGRLKPTVAAQGESVVSAASDANPGSNNCGTCSLDGTSMAAPTAAGLAALVREYYTAGYYASGARDPNRGFIPSGALLKATIMDGAVALGAAAPSPDFDSGYGRILLDSTLPFTGSSFQLRVDDHRQGIATGSVVTHAYDVTGGTPFRATLVWVDYPASLNAATARVNELKLEVIDPNGTAWFQRLDPGTGAPVQTSNPVHVQDTINVEERLVFPTPAAGRWVVRVKGVDVPMGPQPFALVVRGTLSDCPAPAAPQAPALATPAPHQVQVSWNAVAGAASYNVYRSLGSCPAGPWVPVASGVSTTSFLDSGVSGGTPYSYYVTAASDATAFCESAASACASVVPSGDCFLAPVFGGAGAAVSTGTNDCGVALSWNAASPYCGTDVRYNIYRSTSSGFTPGPSNRIARCVGGRSYMDTLNLSHATTYYYVVRAEDASPGHGGPCRGGNEDGNSDEVAASPFGPSGLGTWIDDAGDTASAQFLVNAPWSIATTGGATGPKVYEAASSAGICADLVSPVLTLADPASGPTLSFKTKYDLEYNPFEIFGAEGSMGQVEITTGPGFTNWTRVPLTPNYPALVEAVGYPFNNCPTTALIDEYFSGTNLAYQTYTASLANWAGGDVRIRFHLSGDVLYPTGSWWIDDVQVTQAYTPGQCATLAPGPPPVPDGASVSGQPLHVTQSGASTNLTWDASSCPAAAVNVYWGSLGSFSTFSGGVCGLPDTGSTTLSLPQNVWFVVARTDGVNTDGSWSRDGEGNEKVYSGASTVCPSMTRHVTNDDCP